MAECSMVCVLLLEKQGQKMVKMAPQVEKFLSKKLEMAEETG